MDASTLLTQHQIVGGSLESMRVDPGRIILRCIFTRPDGNNGWSGDLVDIVLDKPSVIDMNFELPSAFEDPEYGEMGGFNLIEAEGTVDAAKFRLVTDSGEISVARCQLSIRPVADGEDQ